MVVLYLNYLVNMSIFIFLLNRNFELNDFLNDGLNSFLLLIVLLFAYDVIKLFFYWYTASVFKTEHETSVHVLNFMLNRAGLSLFLCLSNLLFAYSDFPPKLISGLSIGIIGLLFLYRLIKSIPDYHKRGSYPVHYFILYICTLEINPLLLLGKYFLNV
jgi:small-conductance mechanosensitive channel